MNARRIINGVDCAEEIAGYHHEPHEHPLQTYEDRPERSHSEETAEALEMDRNGRGGPSWTFDWSFNIGHVMAIITVIGGCSSTYFGIKAEIQDQVKETAYLTTRVALIEKDRADKVPRLEEQIRLNDLQDQRIQNLTEALASLRTTVADLARLVTAQSELLHDTDKREAILEERTGHAGPHDR